MHTFNLKGQVVSNDAYKIYEWLDIEAMCPAIVEREIEKADGKRLEIYLSSPGGNVIAGSEIFTTLKNYKHGVTIKITGMAASAATVIASAGDETLMSPTASYMIHNASGAAGGNNQVMKHMAEVLEGVDSTIANAYVLKSGKPGFVFRELMAKETWFTAEEALNMNLIDGIMFDTQKEFDEATANFNKLQAKKI